MMKLRKGKTKSNIESSIDSALLAVEIYNKPRTTSSCQMLWKCFFSVPCFQFIPLNFYFSSFGIFTSFSFSG